VASFKNDLPFSSNLLREATVVHSRDVLLCGCITDELETCRTYEDNEESACCSHAGAQCALQIVFATPVMDHK